MRREGMRGKKGKGEGRGGKERRGRAWRGPNMYLYIFFRIAHASGYRLICKGVPNFLI